MKFNCGDPDKKREERKARKDAQEARDRQWHPWFAWCPVRVGPNECRWLERVERRVPPYTTGWDYWWGEFEFEHRPMQTVVSYSRGPH